MISERTKAILLFVAYFDKKSSHEYKPLTLSEWNRFATWMWKQKIQPEDFLTEDNHSLLETLQDKKITTQRIIALLERKPALGLALERWTNAGIWILNRGDNEYPKILKQKLKDKTPPILFGLGDKALFEKIFVGVVGARNASNTLLEKTAAFGKNTVQQGYGIVSGGAKGIDEYAMKGAVEANGICIGIFADSLLKKSTTKQYRKYIVNGNLLAISPYNPEAGFNVGNAMARNKLIYAMSSITIIATSNTKGGTWEGAKENIKTKYAPLWVFKNNEEKNANAKIVEMGARWLPDNEQSIIKNLLNTPATQKVVPHDLFSETSIAYNESSSVKSSEVNEPIIKENDHIQKLSAHLNPETASLFDFFMYKFRQQFNNETIAKDRVKEYFDINATQLEKWLKQAVNEKLLVKRTKPVSYQLKK